MSDPLALLPFAVAAGGGILDNVETQQWVAAGHTLLMRSAGLVRALGGNRSAILLPPGGAFLTALAASDGRGAVLINPLASRPEIVRQLADAKVGAVFTNGALASMLPPGFPQVWMDEAPRHARVIVGDRDNVVDLGSHFGLDLAGTTDTPGRDEEAVIVYTSAMAGSPLGAILSHRNVIFNARASIDALSDEPRDHCLSALPFAHLFGLIVGTCSPLIAGGRVTTMDRFHPTRALDTIVETDVTRFMGVPSMYMSMLNTIKRRGSSAFTNHKLRLCFVGGAPVAEQLQDEWFAVTGVELLQGYGLTEAAPAGTLTRADGTNERGTMGPAIPGTKVSIRDPETGREVADDRVGEICVRGPHVFCGYVSDGNDGLRVSDGWLHTGDLGVKHSNGNVSFRGLIKPMFTRNGFNIYPREIESAVARMPGVRAVRAWGIPDDEKENSVAIRVDGDVTESDVKQWAKQELAAYKIPSHIEFGAVENQ